MVRGYDAPTSVKKPFLNYRQFLGVGSLVWVPFGCLSNGCHRTESNSSCLFSNESFHWLDTYDGCISNMAIVHRPFPSWSWHRLRNSNMPGLYFWDMSASIERCVWIISTSFHRSVCLIKWLILTTFLLICITVYSVLVMRNSFHSILQPWEFLYATFWDVILHGIGWH